MKFRYFALVVSLLMVFSESIAAQGVMNFNNSPNNFGSTNGVYDNRGNRVGYEVPAPSGVINYFDNSGNRIGYKPKN
jgi:hypothetical protein